MTYLNILAGLVLLVAGGELLVRGAVATALRFGVSAMVIGLTLVGFGTSTPELVTSLEAAFLGAPGIAVGNVVGSNTANILLILGLAAAITPIGVDRATLRRDGTVVMLAALACLAAARRPAPRYAVTDRGRGIVVAGGRADVFALPPRAELAAADATLELGAIDLGELDLRREPGGERVRRRVRLEGVAYPAIVLDLLRRASPP